MKGIIETEFHHHGNNGISHIFIAGDDGITYFGHNNDFNRKSKHYKKGRVVTFDVEDNGRAHPNAVNIDVEVPERQPTEELLSVEHLRDGAYVKRIRKIMTGQELSLIVKDGKLVISCLPEYERDMVWMYQRGPSGGRA